MDVEAAAEAARPLVGPDTLVLSIQNGLGGPDIAARVLGEDRVAVGVAGGFGASIVAPGHAHHHGFELVRLGERHGPVTPRIEAAAEVWRGAGFTVRTSTTSSGSSGRSSSATSRSAERAPCWGRTLGEVLEDEDAWAVASGCAEEAFAVGRAVGVDFAFDDPVAYVRDFGSKIPGAKPSMLLDLEAGRRLEIDFINGAIPRVGREVGVAPRSTRP